jgi:hypothetical protein
MKCRKETHKEQSPEAMKTKDTAVSESKAKDPRYDLCGLQFAEWCDICSCDVVQDDCIKGPGILLWAVPLRVFH